MNSDNKLSNYSPTLFSFSPDDSCLTYLHAAANDTARQLWAVDMNTLRLGPLLSAPPDLGDTEDTLSLDEKLRRERRRAYTLGITTYAWSPVGDRLLIPLQGSLYIQDGQALGGDMSCIYDCQQHGGAAAIDPQFSPDGKWVAFAKGTEVFAVPVEGGGPGLGLPLSSPPQQVTFGAEEEEEGLMNGLADFVAQEEMDRYSGFWWCPSEGSRVLAYVEVDERHIPDYIITHQGTSDPCEVIQEYHRYPFAGKANVYSRLLVTETGLHHHHHMNGLDDDDNHNHNKGSSSSSSLPSHPIGGSSSSSIHDHPHYHHHSRGENGVVGGAAAPSVGRSKRRRGAGGGNNSSSRVVVQVDLTAGGGAGGGGCDEYLARVNWLPDGRITAQVQNRDQTVLRLLLSDPCPHLTTTTTSPPPPPPPPPPMMMMMEVEEKGGGGGKEEEAAEEEVVVVVPSIVLLEEKRSVLPGGGQYWVNLHELFRPLDNTIMPTNYTSDGDGGAVVTPPPEGAFSFLWGSERTHFMHLYLYTYIPTTTTTTGSHSKTTAGGGGAAHLIRAITAGEWIVEEIVGVDEDRNVVYFTGTADSPLERHLYAAPLLLAPAPPNSSSSTPPPPPPPVRLTSEPGMHAVKLNQSCRCFVDVHSSLATPSKTRCLAIPQDINNIIMKNTTTSSFPPPSSPTTTTAGGGGGASGLAPSGVDGSSSAAGGGAARVLVDCALMVDIHDALDRKVTAAAREKMVIPEIFSFRPRSSSSSDPLAPPPPLLYGALYRPNAAVHGPGPYPAVVSVYGGPNVQKVNMSWAMTVDTMAQRLRDLGLAVIKCDNRGSARRGLAFEGAVRWDFGGREVMDQAEAVQFLVGEGVVNPAHVGMYGWSYGGYMSCMSLCKAPNTFRVAVAGAPVTSWDGYDTHYTERYMGTPEANPDGYTRASVLANVDKMAGRLMLVHGQIDENVHFRHTTRLINALIGARKNYELVLFPDGRHSLRRAEDRMYLEQRLTDFLIQHLLRGGGGGGEGRTRRDASGGSNSSSSSSSVGLPFFGGGGGGALPPKAPPPVVGNAHL